MNIPVVSISTRTEDIQLAKALAAANRLKHFAVTSDQEAKEVLTDYPQALVFWELDHPLPTGSLSVPRIDTVLNLYSKPFRVFGITDKALNTYSKLSEIESFGHHLYRRFEGASEGLLSRLMAASFSPHPFGLQRYLPSDATLKTIQLTQSSHRNPAVQALENVLQKENITARLASAVARAVDELLMNAIFDAPVFPDGKPSRKHFDRAHNFTFETNEHIELSIGRSNDYLGVCVTDHFGMLSKEVVLSFIRQNFKKSPYNPESGKSHGLGLNGVIQSGLSLLFVSKPKSKTEVMVFFPRAQSYKDFREGFRFLSLLSN